MPSTFIQQILAFGLAALGTAGIALGPDIDPTPAASSAPEMVTVDEAAAAASQIDPALLNNATLRRAIAQVGPQLLQDPEVREAVRTGHFPQSLMNNPTVSSAMLRVGPSLLSDPELSAAVRSGELSMSMLSDPAVLSILRGLDPTLFDDEPSIQTVGAPTASTPPASPVHPTPVAHDEDDHGRSAIAHQANETRANERDQARAERDEDRDEAREARNERRVNVRSAVEARRSAARGHREANRPVQAPRGVSSENRVQMRQDVANAATSLLGAALELARTAASNGR